MLNPHRPRAIGQHVDRTTGGTGMTSDPTTLWASARLTELLDEQDRPPKYGSNEWRQLANSDPRRAAAILTAAEMWRQYGDEEALLHWFKEASTPRRSPAERRTLAELDALARPKPPHQLRATAGWPPIAIPGRPGWYRHLVNGQQADRPRAQSRGAA